MTPPPPSDRVQGTTGYAVVPGDRRAAGSSSPLDPEPPEGPPAEVAATASASLRERYAQIVDEGLLGRPVDVVLRVLDVALAAALLVALSPLIAAIALIVRIASGSPVLYRGLRVGRAGRTFTMVKFRTLKPDAETRLGAFPGQELKQLTVGEHTRVGRWLRASQLDELPQLWNVLRGDMSLVGPRPIRPAFFRELSEQIPQYWQRLVVRPGMTGFAQLRVERELSWTEKLAHDLEYIADRSVRLYLRVVVNTAWRLASHPAAHARARRELA